MENFCTTTTYSSSLQLGCCCCQKRSIGGRRENLLMSAPIHVRSRSLWLLCPHCSHRFAASRSSRGWWRCRRRPHAYCCWHLGGKCVLTPQKTQQMQSKLENNVDSNHWIIVVAGCGGSVKLAAAGERMSSDNFWPSSSSPWCCQQNCPSLSSFPNMDTVSLFLKKRKVQAAALFKKKWRWNDLVLYK